MKTNMRLLVTAFVFTAAIGFTSCQKENDFQATVTTEEEALTASEENTSADAEYDDIAEIGFSVGADLEAGVSAGVEVPGTLNGGGIGLYVFADLQFKIGACTKVEVSSYDSVFPKTVTINYGEGCICRDGKFRKGIVELNFTGPIRKPGSVLTITLKNYYVNRAHIEGTKVIKNLSGNSAYVYSSTIINGKLSFPNGRGFKYEGTKTISQTAGIDTRSLRDDVYSIEGRNKTIYANGITVIKNTETPLVKPVSCNWIVKGELKIKINDRALFINFGTGECDNKATLKWANGEKLIILP